MIRPQTLCLLVSLGLQPGDPQDHVQPQAGPGEPGWCCRRGQIMRLCFPDRVPRLPAHPHPSSETAWRTLHLLSQLSGRRVGPCLPPPFPFLLQPGPPWALAQVPLRRALAPPTVGLSSCYSGLDGDCFGRRGTPPSCQPETLTLCLASCTALANSCLAGLSVCLSGGGHQLPCLPSPEGTGT